jgi:signal transduction histidine kinase
MAQPESGFLAGPPTGVARFLPVGAAVVAGDPEDTLEHLMSAVALGFGAQMAYVALTDGNRLVLLTHRGMPQSVAARGEMPAHGSVLEKATDAGEALFIDDLRRLPDLADSAELTELGAVGLAVIPLRLPDGEVVGALCLGTTRAYAWSDGERTILNELAAAATLIVRHRDAIHASGALRAQVAGLGTSVRALTEQVRRLSALVENHEDPRVRTFAALATGRVKDVERRLADTELAARSASERTAEATAVTDVSALITRSLGRALGADGDAATVRGGEAPVMARADPIELERALTALLISVRQFATGTERIQVRVLEGKSHIQVEVTDRGRGIPASEVARLLSSFDVAGSASAASLQLVNGTVYASRGVAVAESSTDGTVFRITLPRA